LKVEQDADRERIMEDVEAIGVIVLAWESSPDEIAREQHRPERQGLLGTLSLGVLSTGILTIVGFWFYATHSFRRRFVELGVLRAIGMSNRQMMAFLGWELAILLLVGLALQCGLTREPRSLGHLSSVPGRRVGCCCCCPSVA
jgi:putative ABC transport system permease protein